jgi:hypothetical protein
MFAFCKPVSSKKRFLPFRELNTNYSFSLFENALSIPDTDWNSVTQNNTIFLEKEYLRIVEDSTHTKLKTLYVIVYFQGKACGIIYFQIADFRAEIFGDLLSNPEEALRSKRLKLFENYLGANKDEVLLRLFTCGNNLASGEYGYLFGKSTDPTQAHLLLLNIIDVVSKEEKLKGGLSAILIKDFHTPLQPKKLFEDEKYSTFFVEPNLMVDVPETVHSIEDYIALFSKKYRNRAKGILKQREALQIKQLKLEEIKALEKEIYSLYENIFEKAKFKLIKLPTDYFSRVKQLFENEFTVKAYFHNDKLVAFASSFLMPDNSLEAHYIGFDYELNTSLSLYQNILYSMIEEAILNKRRVVNLGRTAAEIKTTVGAKAYDLICYIKPQNTISKLIQKPFISFLQPADWTPRNPFKEAVGAENHG